MVSTAVKKTADDIKKLRIQGARNIALAALSSLEGVRSKKELEESIALLSKSRP
ncbi:hypothetical protein H0N95_02535, partial [Candidatus Micrarchaeota archaeon]|nr:hypothetical protein [Candidatus Micrarchaeota archaeon]